MDAKTIKQIIVEFVRTSPENSLKNEAHEPAWDEPLIGFSSGSDPIYQSYKEHVGLFHFLPEEIFNLTFPDSPATSEELTVICWILPQREVTKADNRAEDFYPSERWVRARFPGEDFNILLRKHVVEALEKKGIQAVAPTLSPHWKIVNSPQFGLASCWSERHGAHASGLGTFGLCDGLITAKGKAHRVGNVVARVRIPPTPRPYKDHREYCLFFSGGGCMVCAERCPVGAITEEGHNKKLCWDHAGGTCAKYVKEKFGFDGYGCGLCQTGVPCESCIP
ncbi:MAG: 4Fe-4S ferredoxin [Deltaproteobacteria bacterium RBG_13_43_22]|nr:MAG: 4Fe-4S ferredoxin [Deltaproteobacteria bacterium RBG_13_43_22]